MIAEHLFIGIIEPCWHQAHTYIPTVNKLMILSTKNQLKQLTMMAIVRTLIAYNGDGVNLLWYIAVSIIFTSNFNL